MLIPFLYVQPLSEQLDGRLCSIDLHSWHVQVVDKDHAPGPNEEEER